MKHKQHNQLM